ncbi:MAG: hypothetical protein C4542_09795 [Dehalococcoidia bacterium]|nr:MAG: hypothetical protein C4542_09795 [Dehalococcoidia bacterium]
MLDLKHSRGLSKRRTRELAVLLQGVALGIQSVALSMNGPVSVSQTQRLRELADILDKRASHLLDEMDGRV